MPRTTLVSLLLVLVACAPAHAQRGATTLRDVDRARDKGCARGAEGVFQRVGTLRVVRLDTRSHHAAICDVRHGRVVIFPIDGTERSDREGSVVRRRGNLVLVLGFRNNERAGLNPTYSLVDVRRGVVVDRVASDKQAVLRSDGSAVYATYTRTSRVTGLRPPSRLMHLGADGRRDALALAPISNAALGVNGNRIAFGPPSRRVTVDVAAQSRRHRVCQPGRTGTADATFTAEPVGDLAIWTLAGVTRACPAAPTGELRLPCGAAPATAAVRLARAVGAGSRLAVHCTGGPDVVHVFDTATRATLAAHPLGGSGLESELAVSPDGFVAFGTRLDGAPGPLVNVLQVTAADGTAPRTVGDAGHLVRNVRFTAPRTLQWTERNRDGGPAEGRSATL